jgi:putative membrane protein
MQSKILGMTSAALMGALMASASWAADDAAFLQDAIQGSMAEVQMGELAQKNGESEDVRAFGAALVTDHSESLEKATDLAEEAGASVPDEPKPEAQKEFEELQGLTGAEFDKAFAEHMVMNHEKEIQKFEEQAQSGSGEVAEFAKATLPTLQQHPETAKNLAANK